MSRNIFQYRQKICANIVSEKGKWNWTILTNWTRQNKMRINSTLLRVVVSQIFCSCVGRLICFRTTKLKVKLELDKLFRINCILFFFISLIKILVCPIRLPICVNFPIILPSWYKTTQYTGIRTHFSIFIFIPE